MFDEIERFNKFTNMKTITFKIPDTVDIDKNEAAMLFASKLYKKGKLSLG